MDVKALLTVKGKVAIVTGASSGLGITFAEALAEAGADVVVAARRLERLRSVAERLQSLGVRSVPVQCDVTQPDDVEMLVERTLSELGSVDILVNNAGAASLSPATEMSLEEWNRVLAVNLTGVFLCARRVARHMIQRGSGGKIINIASIFGAVGDVFPAAPYYATKGAVINLTRDLAVEWAPHRIKVNAIAPGFFPSEMT